MSKMERIMLSIFFFLFFTGLLLMEIGKRISNHTMIAVGIGVAFASLPIGVYIDVYKLAENTRDFSH